MTNAFLKFDKNVFHAILMVFSAPINVRSEANVDVIALIIIIYTNEDLPCFLYFINFT